MRVGGTPPSPSPPPDNATAIQPGLPPPQSPLLTPQSTPESESVPSGVAAAFTPPPPLDHGEVVPSGVAAAFTPLPPPDHGELVPSGVAAAFTPPPPPDYGDHHDGGGNNNMVWQLDCFPPGYRFNPYDKELFTYYLEKKIMGRPLPPNKIHEVNLYDHNPKDLAVNYPPWGEKKWYFFTSRDRKYPNGNRPNRAAGDGYWKATGSDEIIYNEGIYSGVKKALVFYRGRPPKGEKTNWVMHEFRIDNLKPQPHERTMKLDDCVLCSIHEKTQKNERPSSGRHRKAKPRRTSNGKRIGRKSQHNGALANSHLEEELEGTKLTTSFDHGGLSSNNLDEADMNIAELGPASFLQETTSYPSSDSNGYHGTITGINLLDENYEKHNNPLDENFEKHNISCLRDSQVLGLDLPMCPMPPDSMAANDYTYTGGEDISTHRSDKYQVMEEGIIWYYNYLDTCMNEMTQSSSIVAENPLIYSRLHPHGYDGIPYTNAMHVSTHPEMGGMDVTPSVIHETAGAPSKANYIMPTSTVSIPNTLAGHKNMGEVSEPSSTVLNAGANFCVVHGVDGLNWKEGWHSMMCTCTKL